MRKKESKYRPIIPAPRNRGSKLAPDRIQPAEKRLKTILDAATHGYWRWNVSSGAADLSDGWLALMGYSPVNLPEHGAFLGRIVHPDDRGNWNSCLEAHMAGTTEALECECRLRAKAGNYIWFRIRGKTVRTDKLGRPVSLAGTFLDVDAQKLAQMELESSHALLSDIFTASEDSVWVVEPENFELVAFNKAIDDLVFRERGIRLRPGMRLEEIDPARAESGGASTRAFLSTENLKRIIIFCPAATPCILFHNASNEMGRCTESVCTVTTSPSESRSRKRYGNRKKSSPKPFIRALCYSL